MSGALDGKRVVVFGGGSGVGLAAAKRCAELGARVHVAGRRANANAPGEMHEVDGKDGVAVRAMFERIGPIDHLLITAGQTSRGGSFLGEMTEASFRETFDGKFWVQVNAAHAGARYLQPGGSLTFVSGGANRRAMAGMANIAAANGALDALVPPLALELAPIRVNAISPGTLRTPYWTGISDAQREAIFDRMAKALPAGRVGTADDIAEAVLFVMTNGFLTGAVLAVDGGLPHASF